MSDTAKMTERAQLAHQIAKFQHNNDSLHRHHDLDKATCSYCDLVGHYAVRTMLEHPNLLVKVLLETGALAQCGWWEDPTLFYFDQDGEDLSETDGYEPVYRLVTEENRG